MRERDAAVTDSQVRLRAPSHRLTFFLKNIFIYFKASFLMSGSNRMVAVRVGSDGVVT